MHQSKPYPIHQIRFSFLKPSCPLVPPLVPSLMAHKSDLAPAAIGFFGGAILLAVMMFALSRWTTAQFAGHDAAPAGQQAH